jgi:pimeloyl-ACP methyl ester carboxylesterase
MDIQHSDRETNGICLHVAAAGPADGPLVVLLHGFPEYWGAWRAYMATLAAAGFRVLAPDQRGYNTSDKPTRVADYRLDILAADIVGLIDGEQRERAFIVGHDWGGAVAWRLAQRHPDRVERVVVLNCCPAEVLQAKAFFSPSQLMKSWYIFAFQLPWLPEWAFGRGDFATLTRGMVSSSREGTFGDEALAGLRTAWGQPGAMTAMLAWYRAAARRPPKRGGPITVPALLIWGEQDRFLGTQLLEPTMALCEQGTLIRMPDATHWVNHEEAEAICAELIRFFQSV